MEVPALAQRMVEHPDVEGRREGGCERRADVAEAIAAECRDQDQIAGKVHADGLHGVAYRRFRILTGIITGGQDLHENVGRKPEREGRQRPAAPNAVDRREMAVLEEAADDRLGREDEGDRCRERQEERQFDAAILGVHRFGVSLLAQLTRHGRKKDGPKTDADQAERQLV